MATRTARPRRRPVPPLPTGRELRADPGQNPSERDISQPSEVINQPTNLSIKKDDPVLRTSLDDKFNQRQSMSLYEVPLNGEIVVDLSSTGDLGVSQEENLGGKLEDVFSKNHGNQNLVNKDPSFKRPLETNSNVLDRRIVMGGVNKFQEEDKASIAFTDQAGLSSKRSSTSYRKGHGRAPGLKTLYGGKSSETTILPSYTNRVETSKPHDTEEFQGVELPKVHKASVDWRKRLLAIKENSHQLTLTEEDTFIQPDVSSNEFLDDKNLMSTQVVDSVVQLDSEKFGGKFKEEEEKEKKEGEEEEGSKEADWANNLQQDPDTGSHIIHISKRKGTRFERQQMLRFLLGLAASLVSILMVVLYLYLRYTFILEVTEVMPQNYTSAWLLLVVETIVWTSLGLASVFDVFSQAPNRNGDVSRLRIRSETDLPVVDILIITSGYSDDIVMDTVAATLALDYPPSRYRVMVIDNSQSSSLKHRIELFRKRPMNLSYHRVSYDHYIKHRCHPTGFAVYFALQQRSPRSPSPYIAILDGDMIPEVGFLRALVPHITQDASIGLVACRMSYYDLPKFIPGPTASLLQMTGTLSRPNHVTLQGIRSGILLRRSAMKDIGGFPVYSCIDDGAVVALLSHKGYRSVIVKESVQCGMGYPSDFVITTRHASALRIGTLKIALSIDSLRFKILGLIKPICQMIFSFIICCCIISIPIQFFSNQILIPILHISQLAGLIQLSFLMIFSFGLRDLIWCTRSSTPTFRRRLQTWAFISPYDMINLLLDRINSFNSNNIHHHHLHSTRIDSSSRSKMTHLRRTTIKGFAWFHLLLAITILASVGYKLILMILNRHQMSAYQTGLLAIIGGAFWPTFVFIDLWLGLLVPFSIALKSNDIPFREELLIRDPFTMVARPKLSARTYYPFIVAHSPTECIISLIFWSYSLFLLALSFIKTKG
ncbi:hypothetical protein CROQUDRAFT_664821 [Cronartium quercuum f. sp. fusiforme G11]|uniref:Uncharacterized protein n=1 Tax=Cronartium quercuum f. sp. fusiforme G11 TaxID=708437 RepID=A0A9P6NAH5_9BASI|nr:hypothetical protein CROQUDRAFT_664821 [Cronartium quercuum f. sp. fusiforme G11]